MANGNAKLFQYSHGAGAPRLAVADFAIYFVNNLEQSFKRYDNFCTASWEDVLG